MAFCSKCGQKFAEGARFCSRCGQPAAVPAAPGQAAAAPYPGYEAPGAGYGFSQNANIPEFQAFARRMRSRGWIFLLILAVLALAGFLIFVKENLPTILLAWAVVVSFTAFLSLISNSKTKKGWEGQLVDKRIVIRRETDQDSDITHTHRIPTLFFRTREGKTVKMELGYQAGAFEYYEIGCHVKKHKGYAYPEKYEKDGQIICVYCGMFFDRQQNNCPRCKLIALK